MNEKEQGSHRVTTIERSYEDNKILMELLGIHNSHITYIEQALQITIISRGNHLIFQGEEKLLRYVSDLLDRLYARIERGIPIGLDEVKAELSMMDNRSDSDVQENDNSELIIKTKKRKIYPRSVRQKDFLRVMQEKKLVFCTGPAGTGKTYLAVAKAVEALSRGEVDRIILTRPAVEAGEKLGFLPGDIYEKIDPYLRPLYDAIQDMLPGDFITRWIANDTIEVAPLAFMRGRTLTRSFIILDEAQNTTPLQMKMFLTRLGEGSYMVVTGDLSQVDLPTHTASGLCKAVEYLSHIDNIGIIQFNEEDVVRHALVAKIITAWEKGERQSL